MTILSQPETRLPAGSNRCKCGACGSYFGGVRAFELHRVGPSGDRRCLAPASVRDTQFRPLLRINSQGYWVQFFDEVSRRRKDAA